MPCRQEIDRSGQTPALRGSAINEPERKPLQRKSSPRVKCTVTEIPPSHLAKPPRFHQLTEPHLRSASDRKAHQPLFRPSSVIQPTRLTIPYDYRIYVQTNCSLQATHSSTTNIDTPIRPETKNTENRHPLGRVSRLNTSIYWAVLTSRR